VFLHECVLGTILLEGPIVSKHGIAVLESDWKHFVDITIMIDRTILENDLR
jgi:hypothetical protein